MLFPTIRRPLGYFRRQATKFGSWKGRLQSMRTEAFNIEVQESLPEMGDLTVESFDAPLGPPEWSIVDPLYFAVAITSPSFCYTPSRACDSLLAGPSAEAGK